MSGLKAAAVIAMAAGFFAASTALAAEAPMKDCNGFPCVDVRTADGATLRLAIDTGDAVSVLDAAKAKAMGLVIEPAKDKSGKPVPGFLMSKLTGLMLGGEPIGDAKFLIQDLSKDITGGIFPHADGSIAYTTLKSKLLTLDYKRHVVRLADAPSDVPCATACGTITYPTFGHRGPPIVVTTGFRVNGQDVSVQVDTLYGGTMLIYPTSVDKLGLASEAASKIMDNFPFTDGGVDMIRGQAAGESFEAKTLLTHAPLYFATPKVHLPDGMFDGTVGAALFAGHVVNLDFRGNRFWLE